MPLIIYAHACVRRKRDYRKNMRQMREFHWSWEIWDALYCLFEIEFKV